MLRMIRLGRLTSQEQLSSSYGWFVLGNWFYKNSRARATDDLSGDWFCKNSRARATDDPSWITDFEVTVELMLRMIRLGRLSSQEQSSTGWGWSVWGDWLHKNSQAHAADDLSGDWFCNNSWAWITDELSWVTDFAVTVELELRMICLE